jgi:hypothetical protein
MSGMESRVPALLTIALLACSPCGAIADPLSSTVLAPTLPTRWRLPPARPLPPDELSTPGAVAPPFHHDRVQGESIDAPPPVAERDAPPMLTLWQQEEGRLSLGIGGRGIRGVWYVQGRYRR